MPVTLGSLAGKADPAIIRALEALAGAVSRLEGRVATAARPQAPATATDPQARSAGRLVEQQVLALGQRVDQLAAAVAALEAAEP